MKRIERAQKKLRKQLESKELQEIEKENKDFTANLSKELETNPDFSLDVDPTDKYSMSDTQKAFIKNYVDFKSIPMAAELTGIDLDVAKQYFVAYSSQQEIRRINRAMYHRQFSNKLISIDDIGSWLSSLLTDENVPLADRLKTTDKLKVAQMIIDLNLYKRDAINNPENIIETDIESELKALSVKSIKNLLYEKKEQDKKSDALEQLKNERMTPEEEAFLRTLSSKELLELIDARKEDKK